MLGTCNQLFSPYKGCRLESPVCEFSSGSLETTSSFDTSSADIIDAILFAESSGKATISEYNDIMLLNLENNENARSSSLLDHENTINFERKIVVDWIIWICYDFQLSDETLFTAVAILDDFISKSNEIDQINLVAVCALWIASKLNEVITPSLNNMVYISNNQYTSQEILSFEAVILNTLKFDIVFPTSSHFSESLLNQIPVDENFENFVSLFNHCALFSEELIGARSSHISLASIILAKIATDTKMSFNVVTRSLAAIDDKELHRCLSFISRVTKEIYEKDEYSVIMKFEPLIMVNISDIEDVEKKLENMVSERFDVFLDNI